MLAAIGLDRVLRDGVGPHRACIVSGAFGLLALLGAAGALQGSPKHGDPRACVRRSDERRELRSGAARLLLFAVLVVPHCGCWHEANDRAAGTAVCGTAGRCRSLERRPAVL